MKIATILAAALVAAVPLAAQSANLTITDAKIAAGRLSVTGQTPLANQTVTLDGKFTRTSNASRVFVFTIASYLPPTCIAKVKVGSVNATGVVANCAPATAGFGANLSGGKISLSGGFVATGHCKDVTLSVTGAKVGQVALVSLQGAVQEGVFIAVVRVPSNDHVTMKVCNHSGATMSAIVNLPLHIITLN